jgi:hypothetical protein
LLDGKESKQSYQKINAQTRGSSKKQNYEVYFTLSSILRIQQQQASDRFHTNKLDGLLQITSFCRAFSIAQHGYFMWKLVKLLQIAAFCRAFSIAHNLVA